MQVERFRSEVYNHMLATRGKKYNWFLRALRSFKYLERNPARGEFLETFYTVMRYIDDIVDGDAPLPRRYRSSAEFVDEKIRYAQQPGTPQDSIDHLIAYCFEQGRRFGCDFSEETQDILRSLRFDAERFGTGKIFRRSELEEYFYLLDIRGTIRASLKVFGEEAGKDRVLGPLGSAVRKSFNLKDYFADVSAGLINIPQEDIHSYGIKDLGRESPALLHWRKDEAREGMCLLQEHRQTARRQFKPLTALTLKLVYERPAKRCFARILSQAPQYA